MPPAVTHDSIKAVLDEDKLPYTIDNDQIIVSFTEVVVLMRVRRQLLSVTGIWRADITTEADCATALKACRRINEQYVFPKAYLQEPTPAEAGSVCFDVEIPIENGMFHEQLATSINQALNSFSLAQAEFGKELPHLVTWEEKGE